MCHNITTWQYPASTEERIKSDICVTETYNLLNQDVSVSSLVVKIQYRSVARLFNPIRLYCPLPFELLYPVSLCTLQNRVSALGNLFTEYSWLKLAEESPAPTMPFRDKCLFIVKINRARILLGVTFCTLHPAA